ncbi:MAG TPA: SPOR domain-containing protein [Vicinamibacterales bacterium]|nr:SPOR domain-containing protein [Vicinamibacterales bacterium]
MAHQIQDDGFHEIQLNGKQLVFLFMAATVVSVVIFLCGVLVGRGVRVERSAPENIASAGDAIPAPAAVPPAAQAPAGSDPTTAPPPASEDLTYFNRLEKQNAPAEKLKAQTAEPKHSEPKHSEPKQSEPKPSTSPRETASTIGRSSSAETRPPAVPVEKAKRAATKPDSAPPIKESAPAAKETERAAAPAEEPAPPAGDGFAVQIAALIVRSEADAIAKRLSSKGYAAYVLPPANGTPAVYRVRVGKFPTKREAESVASRLQREEQFKPWVTR